MPPLFLVMFPGEAPESYIAPASRLYPPFGRVIFCRRRRQSLGVRAVRARFYSDVPQRCHSVAPPHKNVPPRAALLNILSPKGDEIFHTRKARISPPRSGDFTRRLIEPPYFTAKPYSSVYFALLLYAFSTGYFSALRRTFACTISSKSSPQASAIRMA